MSDKSGKYLNKLALGRNYDLIMRVEYTRIHVYSNGKQEVKSD